MKVLPVANYSSNNKQNMNFKAIIKPINFIESGSGLEIGVSEMFANNYYGLLRVFDNIVSIIKYRFADEKTLEEIEKNTGEKLPQEAIYIAIKNTQRILTGKSHSVFQNKLWLEEPELENAPESIVNSAIGGFLRQIETLPDTKEVGVNLFVNKLATERPVLQKIEFVEQLQKK